MLLNILNRAWLVNELIFPDFHFLNLVAVVELHSLCRLVNGFNNFDCVITLLECLLVIDLGVVLLE